MKYMNSIIFAFGLVIALAGCSSTPIANSEPSKQSDSSAAAKPAATPSATSTVAPGAQTSAKTMPPYLDPNSALHTKRSIYFDFDNFLLRKEFDQLLEMHGKYLAQNPSLAIKIEGNADERGGTEYNLALGQKRAETVANALRVYGVKASQVESVSWGEEKPKDARHNEAAWDENRRADLVYPKQ